eukprot:16448235-Heterocapsa_arctica.AAC.1
MIAAFITDKAKALEFASAGVPEVLLSRSSAIHLPGSMPEGWGMEPVGTVGPHIFDAAPPRGKRHMILQVEKAEADGEYSLLFMGNTWAFRAQFDGMGIAGGHVECDGHKEYVRCLQGVGLAQDSKDRVTQVLGSGVLNGHALIIFNETADSDDEMISWLASFPQTFMR